MKGPEISVELRRKGVAAETIRFALAEWIDAERDRLIAGLAQSSCELAELLKLKADATALFKIKRELELAMGQAGIALDR